VFFLDMFLSATHFPMLALTAQASQGLPLCNLLLSPGQAGGSGGTIRKGRSHHLHARKPCPHLAVPIESSLSSSQISHFFLISAPALEALGHPACVSCRAVKGGEASSPSPPPAPGERGGVGAPNLHRGQMFLASPPANAIRLGAAFI